MQDDDRPDGRAVHVNGFGPSTEDPRSVRAPTQGDLSTSSNGTPALTPSAATARSTFDPLPPLSPPMSSSSPGKRTPLSPQSQAGSSTLYANSSLHREQRPTALYIPINDTVMVHGSGSGDTPTWPFDRRRGEANGGGADEAMLFAPVRTPMPLTSPSQINPAYALPPIIPTSPRGRKSSPRLGSSSDDEQPDEKRYSVSRSPSRNNAGAFQGVSVDTRQEDDSLFRPRPSPALSSGKESRHSSSYSMGTHALLSSRQTLSSRLARQMDSPTAWLAMYFAFNLGLTLFNKLVLQGFPFPWTLTGIQMLSGTIGTQIALNRGYFVQASLSAREGAIMLAFSTLYTVNIAVSNLSLHLVTVPFHQVVRAMTPLFTILINAAFFHKRYSRNTYLSLLPVVVGVVFATYGDYYFTAWGLVLTLLGTLLAAIKTITTNRVQVGKLKLHPLDLLIRMSPLAFMQCVLWGWYSGELERVRIYGATKMTRGKALSLLMNGVIAFGLNVVSFTANKKTSALTMTVAANVKQVLTIILAVLIFSLSLNVMNLFGITLTLAGGAWYARVELQEKAQRSSVLQITEEKRPLN